MTDGVIIVAEPGRSGGIVEALNREWQRLDCDHRGTAVSWAERHLVLSGCRSLADVLAVVRSHPDTALRALLAEVAMGDQLAGRVVLQSMIGRLVRMSERDVRAGVDDYVAALWCQIVTYPLDRRPVRVSANLALDTLKAVLREHRWLVRGEVATWPPGALLDEIVDSVHLRTQADHGPGEVEQVGAVELLRAAVKLKLIDQSTRSLLASVYVDGLSGSDAAGRHGTTAGSVRVRCCKAMHRLSQAGPALLEAA